MTGPATRIVAHIDRVVLRGFEGVDAASVSAALREALVARLGAEGAAALTAHAGAATVRAGTVRIAAGGGGDALGRAVAARLAAPAETGVTSRPPAAPRAGAARGGRS